MEITPFVDEMAAGLRVALSAQTDARQAEILTAAVQAPARLALMGAVSQAAAEASTTLPAGRIGVQLTGQSLVVAYEPGPAPAEATWVPAPTDSETDEDGQARLTLRLPSSVKVRAEQAAAAQGISLNTWVVRALRDATSGQTVDLNFGPMGLHVRQPSGRRLQGWV
ncbi:MAG: toxin-antitoxin system HicB family antitoxin [Micrococcales bacterium]|nr:toxin-antitoxin system HicB family antitoxin [Micrococcales bacterium]